MCGRNKEIEKDYSRNGDSKPGFIRCALFSSGCYGADENETVPDGEILYTVEEMLEKWPTYTVGLSFLIMTLACEMPIVYNALKKETEHHKKLAWVIVGSNVLTTALTAIVERTLCYGRW